MIETDEVDAPEILEQGAPRRRWARPLAVIAGLIVVAGSVAAEGSHAYQHRLDKAHRLASRISVTTEAFTPGAVAGSADETLVNRSEADQDLLGVRLSAAGVQMLTTSVQRDDGSRSVQVADESGVVRFPQPIGLRSGRTLDLALRYRISDCNVARNSRWILTLSIRAAGHVVERDLPAVSIDDGRSRGLVSCPG